MAQEKDKLSAKEFGSDLATGMGGAILGAVMSPVFNRNSGVGLTRQIGEALAANKDKIIGPMFSRLSMEDERIFAGIELKLTDEHVNVPFRDILSLMLKRMGPWASDRFRSIAIGIPNPTRLSRNTVPGKDGMQQVNEKQEQIEPDKDYRLIFLIEVIKDVIRFGKPGTDQSPPDFEVGIEEVLKNLKIRNIADADAFTAQVSRWWNDKPIEGIGQKTKDVFLQALGVESVEQVTVQLLEAKVKEFASRNISKIPNPSLPRENDKAWFLLRFARRFTPGSFPNASRNITPSKGNERARTIGGLLLGLVLCLGAAYYGYTKFQDYKLQEIINQPVQKADEPAVPAPTKELK